MMNFRRRALVGFLCLAFSISAQARLGESAAQLLTRFGKSYTIEEGQPGKTYKFRSANVSVDVVVANGRSISETYFSDHPLSNGGEPPNDIVRAVLKKNVPQAQNNLGLFYANGRGVPKDYVEAYKWMLLAAGQGSDQDAEITRKEVATLERFMTREQIAEGQRRASNFKPRTMPPVGGDFSNMAIAESRPQASGSGFFITEDGYLITNEHVVGDSTQVRVVTVRGILPAKVVKTDTANDLALLKAEGKFGVLPVTASRATKLGATVVTVGFPNIGLQGFAPKLTRGDIGSLSGLQDDPRCFQISVPVQPGNSGGALVDEHGNTIGVVSAKLSAKAALSTSGTLPENVNYAVKSSFLLGFLESTPEVAAKLPEPNTKDIKFEEVVERAQKAAALVLVY